MMSAATNDNNDNNNNKIQLILLDRDGVINEDVGSPGVTDPQQLVLTPHAGTAIGNLKRAGYPVVLITNQSCVGKQLITENFLHTVIMKRLQELLLAQDADAIWDDVFCCTTTTDIVDDRRKPAPGMIFEACAKYKVDPPQCVFVGDAITDLQAATRAGVKHKLLVSTGYGSGILQEYCRGDSGSGGDRDITPPILMECPPNEQQQQQHDDDSSMRAPLQSVMPFRYVTNLEEASKWILSSSLEQQQQ